MYEQNASERLPKDLLLDRSIIDPSRPKHEIISLLEAAGLKVGDSFPPPCYISSPRHVWIWSEWAPRKKDRESAVATSRRYVFCRDELTKFRVLITL